MPNPVQTEADAIQVANDFRSRGNVEYNYVTVTPSAQVKFYPTREAQVADESGGYEVFRLKYIDNSGAEYIDRGGQNYITTTSNVE